MRTSRLAPTVFTLLVSLSGCSGGGGSRSRTPAIESLSADSGVVGLSLVITGSRFGFEQGDGAVRFGGVAATGITAWSDTAIVVTVPDVFPGAREVTVENDLGKRSDPAAFEVVLPRALYVNEDITAGNAVTGFSVSGSGQMLPLDGAPWPQGVPGPEYGGDGQTLALHGPTRRVFTSARERLYSWDIDPATGVLTTAGVLALAPGQIYPFGLTLNAAGTLLFATEYDLGTVIVASVAPDGTLAQVAGSPFTAAPGVSQSALSLDGARFYANNENAGEIYGWSVAADGTLSPLPGSPYALSDNSYAFVRAPDADRFYVAAYNSGYVATLEPLSNGALGENSSLRASAPGAATLAIDGTGSRLYAMSFGSTLYVFDLDSATGVLTPVPGSPFTVGTTLGNIVHASADGNWLVVAQSNAVDELHVYSIDAAGTPVEVAGSPFALDTDSEGSGMAFTF